METNLTYTKVDDYLIPDIRLTHTGEEILGKYGRMRRVFLENTSLFYLVIWC